MKSKHPWYIRLAWPLLVVVRGLLRLEQGFYALREVLWNYPDTLFSDEDSFFVRLQRVYLLTRPYSYFATATLATLAIMLLGIFAARSPLFARSHTTLIEGVVMGVDEGGRIQKLPKVNPLVPSNIQLERDLSELIYEPLIRYEQDGSITPILAEQVLRRREGSEYLFQLRKGVKWHDFALNGRYFDADDVIATLQLMSTLEISDNTYVQAIKQMAWEKSGDSALIICTISEAAREKLTPEQEARPCTFAQGEQPILSNFLELISIKIMPAHRLGELNTLNIREPSTLINRLPVGTGKYKFGSSTDQEIRLDVNSDYYAAPPEIDEIQFRLFPTEDIAVQALQNGEVHSVVTASTISLRDISDYPQLEIVKSPVLQNQYWAMYFNLRKDPEGKPLGPSFFQDASVRKAIALGIDQKRILETLLDVGTSALGPIFKGSPFHNPNVKWPELDQAAANVLLEKAGWVLGNDGIRAKGDQRLSFKLTYTNTFDREKTVATIAQNLKQIGVEVVADPRSSKEIADEVVSAKLFEALLYGMHTFVDPDRFELFESSEATKLNLSGYVGSVESVQIKDGKTVRVPKVDRLLELGRSLDPLGGFESRKETYFELQQLLDDDTPAVFLYHPQFLYYTNRRLSNVDLSKAGSIEERFTNIANWRIAR